MGVILANVEVEDSVEGEEADSKEFNQSSPNDWVQVNQVGNEEQKINKWLIEQCIHVHDKSESRPLRTHRNITGSDNQKWEGYGRKGNWNQAYHTA